MDPNLTIWSYRTWSEFTFSLEAKGTNPNFGYLNKKIYCSSKKILIISEIPWPSTKMNTYFCRLSRFQLISHSWYIHCMIMKGAAQNNQKELKIDGELKHLWPPISIYWLFPWLGELCSLCRVERLLYKMIRLIIH